MSRRGGLAGLFAMLLAVSSSSAGQESYSAVVGANTRFALKFFRQATADTPNNNVLIAPTALSLDFALLQNGARPEAKAEVMDIFGFGNLSSEQINRQSASLREALSYRQPELPKGIKRGPLTETGERLILARSLWTPEPAFTPNFLAIARKFYGVSPTRLPSGEKAAVTAVNSWGDLVESILTRVNSPRKLHACFSPEEIGVDDVRRKEVRVLPWPEVSGRSPELLARGDVCFSAR